MNSTYYFISLLPAISSNGIGAQFERIRPLQSDFSNFYFFFFFFYNTIATSSLRSIHEEPVSNRFITAIMRGIFRSKMEKLYSKERDFYRRTFIFPSYLVITFVSFLKRRTFGYLKVLSKIRQHESRIKEFLLDTFIVDLFIERARTKNATYMICCVRFMHIEYDVVQKYSKEPNQVVRLTKFVSS